MSYINNRKELIEYVTRCKGIIPERSPFSQSDFLRVYYKNYSWWRYEFKEVAIDLGYLIQCPIAGDAIPNPQFSLI